MQDLTLHILRNPFGYSEEIVRTARLDAADALERLRHTALLHKQDEDALCARVVALENELRLAKHDLVNANFALSLLKGKLNDN